MGEPYRELMKPGENPPEDIYVFIEVPKGSNIKCEYDFEMNVIKIDRVLHTASFYPFNYGFIPETMEEDNDPMDGHGHGTHVSGIIVSNDTISSPLYVVTDLTFMILPAKRFVEKIKRKITFKICL